jgi:hypothetical protein
MKIFKKCLNTVRKEEKLEETREEFGKWGKHFHQ